MKFVERLLKYRSGPTLKEYSIVPETLLLLRHLRSIGGEVHLLSFSTASLPAEHFIIDELRLLLLLWLMPLLEIEPPITNFTLPH